MADYMTLVGAEDVGRAASSMREAAHEMSQAAASIEHSLFQQRQFMEQWLAEFRDVMQAVQEGKDDG